MYIIGLGIQNSISGNVLQRHFRYKCSNVLGTPSQKKRQEKQNGKLIQHCCKRCRWEFGTNGSNKRLSLFYSKPQSLCICLLPKKVVGTVVTLTTLVSDSLAHIPPPLQKKLIIYRGRTLSGSTTCKLSVYIYLNEIEKDILP